MPLKLPKIKNIHPSSARSRVQEDELAASLGGRKTIASGSLDQKGDVRVKRAVRIEAKTTMHKSFSVTLEMLRKIEDAALPTDELPVMVIEFNNGNGKEIGSVCVIPKYALEMICGEIQAQRK